ITMAHDSASQIFLLVVNPQVQLGESQEYPLFTLDTHVIPPTVFGGSQLVKIFVMHFVYIDTENSFLVERQVDIANAGVEHCELITQSNQEDEHIKAMQTYTLQNIFHGYVKLLAQIHFLPVFLEKHSRVKLIIVEIVAFPFRHAFEDMAKEHNLAITMTNQMTTKIGPRESMLVPALGDSWGQAASIRLILTWENKQRLATLQKSPGQKTATVLFTIAHQGFCDVGFPEHEVNSSQCEINPRKRPRNDDEP
uniref:Uncharacterized protein n=1 Tax=Leptobrachium leishanense TaxID=445787 RepID=A0A8C5QSE5_9ANUR